MPSRVILEGSFVRLEPLSPDHIQDLLEAATEGREHYAFTMVPDSVDAMETYVRDALAAEQAGSQLPFTIRSSRTGQVLGSTRFLELDYWDWPPSWPPGRIAAKPNAIPDVAEIGSTWLAQSAQRTGCNTEAKLLMLQLAFDEWGVHRVTLKTDARNSRSRRGIEGLGALFEGTRRAHVRATDGGIRDTAYYSIVRSEWPAVADALKTRLARGSGPAHPGH
ncbi:MAG: GNAT family N-acetyltransferase [Vicinamibacterales bacterium]